MLDQIAEGKAPIIMVVGSAARSGRNTTNSVISASTTTVAMTAGMRKCAGKPPTIMTANGLSEGRTSA